MHSYRKADSGGWYVYFQRPDEPVGPGFDEEFEAAAFANFLNGGRYSPNEIEPIFPKEYPDVTDDDTSIHPDRPKSFDNDYPLEGMQSHKRPRA
jgi:hypothetical protein